MLALTGHPWPSPQKPHGHHRSHAWHTGGKDGDGGATRTQTDPAADPLRQPPPVLHDVPVPPWCQRCACCGGTVSRSRWEGRSRLLRGPQAGSPCPRWGLEPPGMADGAGSPSGFPAGTGGCTPRHSTHVPTGCPGSPGRCHPSLAAPQPHAGSTALALGRCRSPGVPGGGKRSRERGRY